MSNDNLPIMPIVAAKDQQASPPLHGTLRTYAEMGIFTRYSDMPEAPASTAGGDAGEGGMVCEGEWVKE